MGKESYKVSVIVPIFNVEKYIEHCAQTLFEQTLLDIEYIFVNDATLDNSIGILKKCTLIPQHFDLTLFISS